ncbi:MAG: DUF4386 domain-containing protein [Cyclobacteriaceae bacterium]|nr:DUF4386 domain-containing protein [Cyclobacteriaceae bacterium]
MKSKFTRKEIKYAQTIGSLFLMAFVVYGFGRHFFESEYVITKYVGATLILLNSTIVLFIGILFRKTLQGYNLFVGHVYLATRIFEAITLASLVLTLVPAVNFSDDYGYYAAMVGLGVGSIPMCLTLYKHRISPPWLALWGIIGYTVFAVGFLMEFYGKEWSMFLLIPGGLWEITFALWLIIKGGNPSESP